MNVVTQLVAPVVGFKAGRRVWDVLRGGGAGRNPVWLNPRGPKLPPETPLAPEVPPVNPANLTPGQTSFLDDLAGSARKTREPTPMELIIGHQEAKLGRPIPRDPRQDLAELTGLKSGDINILPAGKRGPINRLNPDIQWQQRFMDEIEGGLADDLGGRGPTPGDIPGISTGGDVSGISAQSDDILDAFLHNLGDKKPPRPGSRLVDNLLDWEDEAAQISGPTSNLHHRPDAALPPSNRIRNMSPPPPYKDIRELNGITREYDDLTTKMNALNASVEADLARGRSLLDQGDIQDLLRSLNPWLKHTPNPYYDNLGNLPKPSRIDPKWWR
jgi:hypothetical protein